MSSKPKYLLDANIFIEAYKRYYAFAPSFWRLAKQNAEVGQVISIDRIREDEDALKTWVNNENADVIKAYREIIEWAVGQPQFTEAAKSEFASVADSWLTACAKAHNCVLVTHELYDAHIKRKIPIPNVCRQFGVPYMNILQMLRKLNAELG